MRKYNHKILLQSIELLRNGGIIAVPTDTVYGLAVSGYDGNAVAKIFNIKKRPNNNPIQIMVKNLEEAQRIGEFNDNAVSLANKFWPGGLTIIVKRLAGSKLADNCFCKLNTIGIRVPSHPVMLEIIDNVEFPLAVSSANISGQPPCLSALDVAANFKNELPLIIDGGQCGVGVSSTVVDCTGDKPQILRQGQIKL